MTLAGQMLRVLLLLAVLVRLVPAPVAAALPFDATVCHSDGSTEPAPGPGKEHDCALCPVCLTSVTQMVQLADPFTPPRPTAAQAPAWPRPPATGPPAAAALVPPPRGPPA